LPPPPWPPSTTPRELDAEVSVRIRNDCWTNLRTRQPPPKEINVKGTYFCTRNGTAIRTSHAARNRKDATPAKPKNPPLRSYDEGWKLEGRLVGPLSWIDGCCEGLKIEQFLI